MLTRRRFLGAILGSAVAPAIVRASSLMPVRAIEPDPFALFFPLKASIIRPCREPGIYFRHSDGYRIILPAAATNGSQIRISGNPPRVFTKRDDGWREYLPIEENPARIQLSVIPKDVIAL